jgi:predicted transposase/invertase (TIGR01784 family)
VETEKAFKPTVGYVDSRFDLFAQDHKNRIIVDIQHAQHEDHYDRFLHYHCVALLEQIAKAKNYRPALKVFTIVILTSNDRHQKDVLTIDFDPKDLSGQGIQAIPHKVIYLCPKYANSHSPAAYKEWLDAIQDTLDEQVEESDYHNAMIQRIFTAIEKEAITPAERYAMFEEYNYREQLDRELKEERIKEKQAIATSMLTKGFALETVAELTGLTLTEIGGLLSDHGTRD